MTWALRSSFIEKSWRETISGLGEEYTAGGWQMDNKVALNPNGDAMARVLPPPKQDEITALDQPSRRVRFFKNVASTGEIGDPTFAAPFFGIWLSPQSSDPQLRRALLKLR